jgi:ankyrin repeat protein
LIPEVISFLYREAQVEASSHGLLAAKRKQVGYSQAFPKQMTGLHLAAYFGVEAVVKLLLDKGAQLGIENRGGWTALQLAVLNRHEGLEQLLVRYGSPEPEDFHGLQQLFLVGDFIYD